MRHSKRYSLILKTKIFVALVRRGVVVILKVISRVYIVIGPVIHNFWSQNLLAISCEKLSGILKMEFRGFSVSISGALFLP